MPNLGALESRKWDASDAGKTGHPRNLKTILFRDSRIRVKLP